MYQFYYSNKDEIAGEPTYKLNIAEEFDITAVRPTMWEEHCLECSAPLCYKNCVHFIPRVDGRCKRFFNGLYVYENEKGCCGQGVRVKFRKWANMLTVIFPSMLTEKEYLAMTKKNEKLGEQLRKVANLKAPMEARWGYIRVREYIRRMKLRKSVINNDIADAFLFHGYSFSKEPYHLIVEIFDDHTPVFKTSLMINEGENMYILGKEQLSDLCSKSGYLVKIYPENDKEAELDILWCDFVKGKRKEKTVPASKVKCFAWDLDNTVWDGILIDVDDPFALKLKPHILDTIKELDNRGIIQTVASKNDYDITMQVMKKLGIDEYFIYPQINWGAKSSSLKEVAKLLNIGIDTFALIDDTAFERNEVSSALPQVRVYDEKELTGILSYPEFDVVVTEDSKNRRLMYKAEEKRNKIKSGDNLGTIEFLKKCHLKIEMFTPVDDASKERCYELVVRTNQLNMSGIKYTEEEFKNVVSRENHTNVSFSCSDDFGSYGIVGFAQYKVEDSKLTFTEFAMSCRVAGKFVESAFFSYLIKKENCDSGFFKVNKTKKNILLRRTLEEIGFKINEETNDTVSYLFTEDLVQKDLVKAEEKDV